MYPFLCLDGLTNGLLNATSLRYEKGRAKSKRMVIPVAGDVNIRDSMIAEIMRRSKEEPALISAKNPEPISQQLRRILMDQIESGSLPRGLLIPSERELAETYGISRTSVREGLALLLAEGVLVRGGLRGAYVADGEKRDDRTPALSRQIRFWINEDIFLFVQPGYNRILTGAAEACQLRNYQLQFCAVGERNLRTLVDTPSDPGLLGSIIVGGVHSGLLSKLRGSETPSVLVDFLTDVDTSESIRIDYASGTRTAVEHLVRLGHRSIGFIGFPHSQKYDAFWAALDEFDVPYRPRFVEFLESSDLSSGTMAGFKAMQRILSRNAPPSAIIVTNDCVGLGAREALELANIEVPRQMSIVGFDDLAANSPLLTTVRVDLIEVGRLAATTLLDWIEQASRPAFPIVVPVELVERSSTAPPPSANETVLV